MKRPNPLPPALMSPRERRAELCGLLALGLVRLVMRGRDEASAGRGDILLHSPADRSVHATPTRKETA